MTITAGAQTRVGIVGGGQLALMLVEASLRLDVAVTVLGAHGSDPAVRAAARSIVGDPRSFDDLRALADRTDVLTFDHELVSPHVLDRLEREGVVLRPSAAAMTTAVDKAAQHHLFSELAVPAPPTAVAHTADAATDAARSFGGAVVVKAARGGYDGRGVAVLQSPGAVGKWMRAHGGPVLVQPALDLAAEVAVQVVRGVSGDVLAYPVVRTVQHDGMCHVVQVPAGLAPALETEARSHALRIAEALGVVGLLAVEFFVVADDLLVNEIATRPHNSGHVTERSSVTSQFENHLRAVCGLPLGATDLVVSAAAMANVIGGSDDSGLDLRAVEPDVSVHLDGKVSRPGRKLGHVTVIAPTAGEAADRAIRGAAALTGLGVGR